MIRVVVLKTQAEATLRLYNKHYKAPPHSSLSTDCCMQGMSVDVISCNGCY